MLFISGVLTVFSILSVAACAAQTERQPMSISAENAGSAEDWSKAETLALEYLKNEMKVSAPISFRRFEATPFLLAAWWDGGGTRVLVYGGKIHRERGAAALPGYFEFLGATRLRTLSVDLLDGMLQALGASRPTPPDVGAAWAASDHYRDLFPAVVDTDGILKYVVHFVQVQRPLPPELGGPPAPSGQPPPKGGRPGGLTLVLQRWSLQLFPVKPALDWKLEGRVERATPPVKFQ
jgi:hypothetical protein